ncbi:GNAT family N-acetyltransferase [Lichenihabitans sp. PAMC28606]|uniref:GNAT family N-acetyltransferase n=1 Tax=Lichenihabitans sp. PAMC28606 TaxID=2880932 RepID=UPI001D0A89BE|nr:GNAT family N-acetyltransferase [Lichenihabitans sp. PAMC28606]UDL93197.1 GNAT family N-acetyltransferase [Lichenihabitans sp. PAMC28606]
MSTDRPKLVIPAVPDRADREILLSRLAEFEAEQAGPLDIKHLAILLKDEAGATIGGLWGVSLFRWLIVELVFVPAHLRGQGLGRDIMAEAERIAIERGCIGIWLDTYDFQAPDFYESLGFVPFGAVTNQPPGHKRIFMQKRLAI